MARTSVAGACAVLLAAIVSCATAPTPPGPDPALRRTSPKGAFVVTLLPPEVIPLQLIHEWRVRVAAPDGTPVTQALVYVNGGMAGHGHGMPTRPEVVHEIFPGTYLVDGMKFSMAGRWEIHVAVQKLPASDVTTFHVVVGSPPASR